VSAGGVDLLTGEPFDGTLGSYQAAVIKA